MKQIKINIPNGFKIKSFDESTGEVNFEPIPKDIREHIKDLKDIFELNNTTEDAFNKKWEGFAPHEKANALEILIVAAYNEGKLPDFTDGTSKACPYFKMGSPSGAGFLYDGYDGWSPGSSVGSRLLFHGKNAYNNMLDAVEKFLPQYKDSRTL